MTITADELLKNSQDDTRLHSPLFLPESDTGPRPAVLVFPEWWGMNDYVQQRARQLVEAGYVALAVDMYGDGRVVTSVEEAAANAQATRTGPVGRARSTAALEQLRRHPYVDDRQVAAIGFCFGGSVALELARTGADLTGVVAFHAALATPEPAEARAVQASLLVLHGAEDPHVPAATVDEFQQEMRAAGADWEFVAYGGAVHSFTNPDADAAGIDGVAHDARAERRAWRHALDFLAEVSDSAADKDQEGTATPQ